jgi:hypothetical protein
VPSRLQQQANPFHVLHQITMRDYDYIHQSFWQFLLLALE